MTLTTEICTLSFFLHGRTDDAIPLFFWQGVIMMNLGSITSNYSSKKVISIFLTALEKVCTLFCGNFVFDNKFVAPTLHILFCSLFSDDCHNGWLPSPKGHSQFTYDVAVTLNQPSILSFVCMVAAVAGQLM